MNAYAVDTNIVSFLLRGKVSLQEKICKEAGVETLDKAAKIYHN